MTTARKQQVNPDVTPYYHCVSRCVRRTFLCGFDELSQRSYEHRRDWIEFRIKELAQIYCIDICAYAVMSNHYHLVLHINSDKAKNLTDIEVIERWSVLHILPRQIKRFLKGEPSTKAECRAVQTIVSQWRERLYSLSWFMRELNFDIAVKANQEDNCKGHFWESRFKSQALIDEKALLAAMAYVDLNPVRAGIADTPENSEYTSVKERVDALKRSQATPPCLHPFIGEQTDDLTEGIPFRLLDYLELLDWTGRQLKENKNSIDNKLPSILNRLIIQQRNWLNVCSQLEKKRALLVGEKQNLKLALPKLKRSRLTGYSLG